MTLSVARQCEALTHPRSVYNTNYRGNAGGKCRRKATHTDGSSYYCTQHAKEPPTLLAKATGKIRNGLRPLS